MDPALLEARQKGVPQMTDQIAKASEEEEKRRAAEENRKAMMVGLISSDGRARLGRIALVNPDKSRAIEDHILNLARTGRLGGEVSEKQIIQILEQMEKESETKIKHKNDEDEDEDFYDV